MMERRAEDIDAVHVFPDGTILLSTIGGATLGGISFSGGDLVLYDPALGTASLYFDQGLFGDGSAEVNAAFVAPEPSSLALLGLGLFLGLGLPHWRGRPTA